MLSNMFINTIQMKASEQYFPVVLFIMLYSATIQLKAGEHYLPVVGLGSPYCIRWLYLESL